MKIYNRLYFGLLLFAVILFLSNTSNAFDKSLDQGLDDIAQEVTKSIPEGAKKTVAVIDFNTLDGNVTMLGRFVSEELITKLFETDRFKVIERSLLEKSLEELKFNTSDLVDPSVAKQLGKVVGADAIVTGTISDLGQSIKINARIITVESGEVIGAAGTKIVNDSTIREMLNKSMTVSTGSKQKMPKEPETDRQFEKIGNKTQPSLLSNRIQKWDNFIFEIQSCDVLGRTLTCYLTIENKGKDRGLGLGKNRDLVFGVQYPTRMFDDLGNEYPASEIMLANKRADGPHVISFLISNITTKASISFKDIDEQANAIALLEISLGGSIVDFRNIPISK